MVVFMWKIIATDFYGKEMCLCRSTLCYTSLKDALEAAKIVPYDIPDCLGSGTICIIEINDGWQRTWVCTNKEVKLKEAQI